MKYRYPLIKKILQSRKGFFDSNDTILSKRFKVNDDSIVQECDATAAKPGYYCPPPKKTT